VVTVFDAAFGRLEKGRALADSVRPAVAGEDGLSADLEAARTGDEAAFARVYRAVQPGLYRYLTVLVGRDAEDVAAETWAQACRDLAKFRGDIDGFRGWVARIGRNRAIDHVRATGRRPVVAAGLEVLANQASVYTTESVALESLATEAAIAMIATLPRDQAEAVLLRAVMGLDAASAGRVLGKRAGAVRTASYRGLQTLGTWLEATLRTAGTRDSDTSGAADADEVR
jgi:RNA polymerase sigma-70 factor (ECF subfamily)